MAGQQDDVDFGRTLSGEQWRAGYVGGGAPPGDTGDEAGHLPSRTKLAHELDGVTQGGDQLFAADERQMQRGKGSDQPGISFTVHNDQRSRFGYGDIGSGNTHIGIENGLPQIAPEPKAGVGLQPGAGSFRKQLGFRLQVCR